MNITFVKEPEKNFTYAFVLKDEERIDRHPLFRLLEMPDKKYLTDYQKKVSIKKDFSGYILLPSGLSVIVLGVGERSEFNQRKAILTARRLIVYARNNKASHLAVSFQDFLARQAKSDLSLAARVLATQFEMANYEFIKYKTPQPEGWVFVQEVAFIDEKLSRSLQDAFAQGVIIGEEINRTRDLANTPGGDMTPTVLAQEAFRVGEDFGVKVSILDEERIAELKMGGVLGVAKGSSERPKFIIMEYLKGSRSDKPIVLVGKGVTFDTGGLNLKPENSIYEMHMDMSGGAAVIRVMAAVARLGFRKNVVGLVPAVENMPSGASYRPGDVLTTMSGKTVEVLNTDAEGRIILADALHYAKRYKPRLIIDVATLTGSAMSALGQRASAVFSNVDRVRDKVVEVGEAVGDYTWSLPLWEEYEEDVRGTFGDVANMSKTRYGGAIGGAVFLWQFIKEPVSSQSKKSLKKDYKKVIPWVHIDMAPRMTATDNEFLAKGAVGAPVGLLLEFLRKF